MASDKNGFQKAVASAAAELSLEIVAIEDAQTLSEKLATGSIDDNLHELALSVAKDGIVRFGTFHVWDAEA
jgi:hypothetical protein